MAADIELITGVFLTSEKKLGEDRFLFLICCYLSQIKSRVPKELGSGLNQSERLPDLPGRVALLSSGPFKAAPSHSSVPPQQTAFVGRI